MTYDIDANDAGTAVTFDGDGNLFVAGFASSNQKAVLWKFRPGPDGIGDVCDDDMDGDGLLNTDEEDKYGTDPLVSDADADTDGDGVSNVDEVDIYGTDPMVANAFNDSNERGKRKQSFPSGEMQKPGIVHPSHRCMAV